MQRLWILIGILLALCAGLIAGARAVSRTAPPPTHLDTGQCAQPCWQSFRPGEFTLDGLNSVGRAGRAYVIKRASSYGGETILNFEIDTAGTLTLADILREWGAPERVSCFGLDYSRSRARQTPVITAQLYFFDGLVVPYVVSVDGTARLTPDMPVFSVTYYAPGEPTYTLGKSTAWLGFASVRRYCTTFGN